MGVVTQFQLKMGLTQKTSPEWLFMLFFSMHSKVGNLD